MDTRQKNISYNGITDTVRFVRGEMSQNEFATKKGISKSSVKGKTDLLKGDFKTLLNKYEQQVNTCEHLRTEVEHLRTEVEQYKNALERLTNENEQLTNDVEHYRTQTEQQKENIEQLTNEAERQKGRIEHLQTYYDKWNGQPNIIRHLASANASMLFLFLLAAFEIAGTYTLLLEKGIYLAAAASLGLGGMLMHFTAKEFLSGKVFAVSYGFCVCLVYFGLVDPHYKNWLFTLTVPTVAALIAFTIKKQ